jgi:integrase/recombinase XerD
MNEHFNNLLNSYTKEKEHEGSSKASIVCIKSTLLILFSYLNNQGIEEVKEVRKENLKSFIKYLIEFEKKEGVKKYRTESINTMIGRIKRFFLWLDEKGILKGAVGGLHFLKHTESVSRNILTRKEITGLFNVEAKTMYEFMMKTIFVLLYASGLRINELLNLRINNINYEAKTFVIYEFKERKERHVHIGEVGINYLKIYLEKVRDKISLDAKENEKVFLSNYEGKSLSGFAVNKSLKEFCKRAGIKKRISSHSFRHSYGSHLLENGAEIKHISELLGHSKLSTTERYTNLSTENLREVINSFHPRENEDILWN